jgi:2-methylisocitrate lyase-like PEP mutase family enzyme
MVGKIAAMADARSSDETLIIARTDAIAVEGFSAAEDRAEAYLEAGADVLFIEGTTRPGPIGTDCSALLQAHPTFGEYG